MKLGAERKKFYFLCGLVVIGLWVAWSNFSSDTPSEPVSRPRPTATGALPPPNIQRATTAKKKQNFNSPQQFRPSMKPKKPGEGPDPLTADPTLRLDLLAKLKEEKVGPVGRSLFDFEAQPAPQTTPNATIVLKPVKPKDTIVAMLPVKPPPPPPPPPPPSAPPIPLKFYGFAGTARPGVKRAFFLDGDDIIVASEGELVKKRYKLVRINVNTATVQDTQSQGMQNSEQNLPLVEERS